MAKRAESIEQVPHILSAREAYEIFDREVHRLMGMSGEEFIRRWDAGEFDAIADTSGNLHIMRLAMMIPGVDYRS